MEQVVVDGKTYRGAHVSTEKANILMIQGDRGFLGCGYFKVETADKLGEAVAIVTGVKTYDDMLGAKVVAVSEKAKALGIHEGMPGREALPKLY
jgi:uncharacterized protein YunC (DUF1805 family)